MKPMRKCRSCGETQMVSSTENYDYTESGLNNVTLCDVEVRRCQACGATSVVLPNIEGLHRLLCLTLASKKGRLAPEEIRFLRTSMGYSSVRFAKKIGVDAATVSKWENGKQVMKVPTEHLIRMMAFKDDSISSYVGGMEMLLEAEVLEPFRVALGFEDDWKPCAA